MSRGDRMLQVLQDGREHSREEILAQSPGGFFLTNNAASDLRKRGLDVRYRVQDGLRLYQLHHGSLDAATGLGDTQALLPADSAYHRAEASPAGGGECLRDAVAGGQLELTVTA